MIAKKRKEPQAVTIVTTEDLELRVGVARQKLQAEIQLVKDLSFLKSHTKLLTSQQERAVDAALYAASDIVKVLSEKYTRVVTELIAVQLVGDKS